MLAFRVAIIVACILSGMAIAGCQVMNRLSTVTTTDAEGVQDDLHAFGRFDPPPPEIALMDPRPAASVQVNPADAAAADELSALLRRTERFDVLSEGDRFAGYRLAGRVAGFTVTASKPKENLFTKTLEKLMDYDVDDTSNFVDAACDVALRLVDAESGAALVTDSLTWQRTDAMKVFGVRASGWADETARTLELGAADRAKILRLAFDALLRRMLPEIDRAVLEIEGDL